MIHNLTYSWRECFIFSVRRIFWSFDYTLTDLYENFNGIASNGPTYLSQGYNGAGACLWLNYSLNEYVNISNAMLKISYTSFTLTVWIFANTLSSTGHNGIFGQIDQLIQNRALSLTVRRRLPYLSFYSNDLSGNQVS